MRVMYIVYYIFHFVKCNQEKERNNKLYTIKVIFSIIS